ncbi:MAG: NAD-dependent epimerase/dehydratase family protein [Candidatus Omnitrophica bacterium]|nr:NAD-dependent epimerase/dehydratase family protein [Candidatus Omnitrophota bacterium]
MKILVLGGHGFVGKNVVDVLKNSQHEVIPLSLRDGLDLTNLDSAKEHLAKIGPEIIINCAAKVGSLNLVTQQAAEIVDYNMRIILNIYKAAQECIPAAHIVNPIANCVFPGHLDNYAEDRVWDGEVHRSVLSYGSTRRMILVLSDCYFMQYGLRSINFFVPNMYGPFDSTDPNKAHALNALISKIVKAKAKGSDEFEVWGRGIAIREWLFAKDFARVLLDTLERLKGNEFTEPINVAQNFGLSVRELVDLIISEMKFDCKIKWNSKMPDGAPVKVMNDERFKKIYPKFEFTDLKSGIAQTIKYYESVYPY